MKNTKINLKTGKVKISGVLFQIVNLILYSFSLSFILAGTFALVDSEIVSANSDTDVYLNTCYKSKTGEICQEFESEICEEKCETPCFSGRINEYSDCKLGCCFDDQEGLCDPRTGKKTCEENNGNWFDNKMCEIQECYPGCCVLGTEVAFVTRKRCEKLSSLKGVPADFKSNIETELECLALGENKTNEAGACVLETPTTKTCKKTSAEECMSITGSLGNFHKGYLCSNPELNTSCKRQVRTGCLQGKDEIYWFDSCENPENIYNSNKDESWNSGKLLTKQDSCNSNSNNAGSADCGNCNYLFGSRCDLYSPGKQGKPEHGEYVCVDMSCVDHEGKTRKNGESWCVYDGYIGEGKDVVGSRHWLHSCIDGEIKVEGCSDYRQQICVEARENDFSIASCRMNLWRSCIENADDAGSCPSPDCHVVEVDVDEGFKFEVCAPSYPSGWDTEDDRRGESAKGICSMATQECSVIYEKKLSGWKCVMNCNCEEDEFAQQMNEFCISLGDCGAYVNIAGKGTNNVHIENDGEISWEQYAEFSKPVKGQKAPPGDISELYEVAGIPQGLGNADYEAKGVKWGTIGAIAGVAGVLGKIAVTSLALYAQVGGSIGHGGFTAAAKTLFLTTGFQTGGLPGTSSVASTTLTSGGGAVLGAASNALMGISIGMLAGSLIAQLFGLKGDAAMVMAAAGAVGGAAIGILYYTEAFSGLCAGPQALTCAIVLIIILIIVALILKALGIGKTKEIKVKFDCLPWQAPSGEADCNICNDDPLKPCTKYRCDSLGKACEFKVLNASGEPYCGSIPNDGRAPVISPWLEFITQKHKYENIDQKGFEIKAENGNCAEAFTPLQFGILTHEKSQCKIDSIENQEFDEMSDFFGGDNFFKQNHSIITYLPSPEALAETLIKQLGLDETDQSTQNEFYNRIVNNAGELDLYVRCQDVHGNKNNEDYKINICVKQEKDFTEPVIIKTYPENNAKIAQSATEKNIYITVDEPAECRYSLEDKPYDTMENQMICMAGLDEFSGQGWPCNFTMQISSEQNKVYIRCKDQPWLPLEKKLERNTNTVSYEYILEKTSEALEIISIEPNREIIVDREPFSLDLVVETARGSENGKAKCEYGFGSENNSEKTYTLFYNTFSTTHTQSFSQMLADEYQAYIRCEDEAGNIAFNETRFAILIDNIPPIVTRAYYNGDLVVVTNEKAICAYSTENCGFDFKNASKMSIGYSITHNADWNKEFSYHIKCKDLFETMSDKCNIIIRASEFPYS